MKKSILLIVSIATLCGCGIKEAEYNKVVHQKDSLQLIINNLEQELDRIKNGEERLMNFIKLHNDNKEYIKALEYLENLRKHHPESPLISKHGKLFSSIESNAKIVQDSIDKAIRDSIKLASINDLGVWKVGDYVNEFDEPTGEHFVVGEFYGTFSNSATAGSRLRVKVQVTRYGLINIYYDEYNNGTYEKEYETYCRIVNKELRKVYYRDYGGQIYEKDTRKKTSLGSILREEGKYEFEMTFEYGTQYRFTIDSKCLGNAMVKAGLISIDELP